MASTIEKSTPAVPALSPESALLSFRAVKATLGVSRDAVLYKGTPMNPGSTRLSYNVKFDDGDSVKIPGKDPLEKLKGSISIRSAPRDAEDAEQGAIGYFAYLPEYGSDYDYDPASYGAEVAIPEGQFNELVAAARAGALPVHIMLRVTGLTYGNAPDGSEKIWPTAHEQRHERVTEISFALPLAVRSFSDEDDEFDDATQSLPPTRTDILNITKLVNQVLEESRRLAKTANWILWLTAAVCLLMLLSRR